MKAIGYKLCVSKNFVQIGTSTIYGKLKELFILKSLLFHISILIPDTQTGISKQSFIVFDHQL